MTRNVGTLDRVLRAAVGVLLLGMAFFGDGALSSGWLHWIALIASVVLLATAAIATCPAYSLLGIRTCPIDQDG